MKVLWFEVTQPGRYRQNGAVIAGWQDSLETIVRSKNDCELTIAFEDKTGCLQPKMVEGVAYIPISTRMNFLEKIHSKFSWVPTANKLCNAMKRIVKDCNPDVIHVFGTEWPFGLIAKHTLIPVVIHIQGAIVPYNNASLPPGYSLITKAKSAFPNLKKILGILCENQLNKSREQIERDIWNNVHLYMGRTSWDYRLSSVMNSNRSYFFVNEALRPNILSSKDIWTQKKQNSKLVLFSTGCSSFWKGPDVLLKTAKVLKDLKIDFEWQVAGKCPLDVKKIVEHQEQLRFEDCNVSFLGFLNADQLVAKLCSCSLYVHTAYIENSPNSICEAQCLGVPVIATNVGGVSSLISDGVDGILVPANDPWQLASAIIELYKNPSLMQQYSKNGRDSALRRHDPVLIRKQLFDCYKKIVSKDVEK